MGLRNVLSKVNRTINPIARGRIEKERKQKVIDDFNEKQRMKQLAEDYPRIRSDVPTYRNLKEFSNPHRAIHLKNDEKKRKMEEKAWDDVYKKKSPMPISGP